MFIILFFSQFHDIFTDTKIKIHWDFHAVFTSLVDALLSSKGAHYRNGARIETWMQSSRFLFHMADDLFFTMKICMNHSNSIHIDFGGWLFHALQMLANHWLPDYHINMLSSNILSLGSFFFQHRPLDTLGLLTHCDTLWSIALYLIDRPKIIVQAFEAK